MKARKFLVLRGIPATSAKSTFIFYLGHLRDDNLSPTERKFIKAVQDSRSTSYILCDELIHPIHSYVEVQSSGTPNVLKLLYY